MVVWFTDTKSVTTLILLLMYIPSQGFALEILGQALISSRLITSAPLEPNPRHALSTSQAAATADSDNTPPFVRLVAKEDSRPGTNENCLASVQV